MAESDWLLCRDPARLLALAPVALSERKLRLIGAACCRAVWKHFPNDCDRTAVEVAERHADGFVTDADLDAAWRAVSTARDQAPAPGRRARLRSRRGRCASSAAHRLTEPLNPANNAFLVATMRGVHDFEEAFHGPTFEVMADLVRDVAGNPYRPVTFAPEWRTSTTVGVADAIYAGRAFCDLPILADALQDAGCDSADVLDHLRGPGPHARGCWALDLVLGRA